jgi:hypothetical protein
VGEGFGRGGFGVHLGLGALAASRGGGFCGHGGVPNRSGPAARSAGARSCSLRDC